VALSPELRAGIGKRAGLTSGLLGMLCVLGELCFLLPDLLVNTAALPVYVAHVGLFRTILWTCIVATLALGGPWAWGKAATAGSRSRTIVQVAYGRTSQQDAVAAFVRKSRKSRERPSDPIPLPPM